MIQFVDETKNGAVISWRVEPGRANLFLAMALFIYYIHRNLDGRIGPVRLSDSVLNKLDCVLKV